MRIIFLTHRLPYPPNRGDRIRAYHLLREMTRWAEVDVMSLVHSPAEAEHLSRLQGMVASVTTARVPRLQNLVHAALSLPGHRPLTHCLLRAPGMRQEIVRLVQTHPPDMVFAYCTGVAPYALLPALRGVPMILDMVDVDSAKWAELGRKSSWPRRWVYSREARTLSEFERSITQRAAVTLVVAPREASALAAIAPQARIEVVPNGVDRESLKRPPSSGPREPIVVFVGVMDYAPNVEGAVWLAREVWPLVRVKYPEARLELIGSGPTAEVLALADSARGVAVTGTVPDVRPYLWRASVAAAPLFTARGIQNKALEALASGLPVVVTPAVAEGLPAGVGALIASTAPEFAEKLVGALRGNFRAGNPPLDWQEALGGLQGLVRQAARGQQKPNTES